MSHPVGSVDSASPLCTDNEDAAMKAMPPLDYDTLATKTDLEVVRAELHAEMIRLHGEAQVSLATTMRTLVLTQLATVGAVAGLVAGLG